MQLNCDASIYQPAAVGLHVHTEEHILEILVHQHKLFFTTDKHCHKRKYAR